MSTETSEKAADRDLPLRAEREGKCLFLTLARPTRRNALDRELVLRLGQQLAALGAERREADESEAPKASSTNAANGASHGAPDVVVLRGAGRAFCAGADLSTIQDAPSGEVAERLEEFHVLIRGILNAPQPVVAAIDGPAVGFGADLALACDVRIMTRNAYIESSFTRIGLMPDGGGTFWFSEYLGARAFEALALGRRLEAEECERLGIANHVVSRDELESATQRLVDALTSVAPLALRAIKRATTASRRTGVEETLAREKAGQLELLASDDFSEGVAAFLAKRPPRFRGR